MKKDFLPVDSPETMGAETDFVEEFWTERWRERDPGAIDLSRVAHQEAARVVEPYVTRLPGGARILDGGCGLGEWTRYYASRGFDAVGMDLSEETVDRLTALFPDASFVRGDIRRTDFPDQSFDAYFSWGAFEHFEIGLGPCFEEAHRILKPGGMLMISVPYQNLRHIRRDRHDPWHWDENFERGKGYSQPMRFYQWRLTRAELHQAFELYGFRFLAAKPIHKEVGLRRALKHDFGLPYESLLHRLVRPLLGMIVPASWAAHMILGVGIRGKL